MSSIGSTNARSPAVLQAKQCLAKAEAAVAADRAAHSPGCVATDEKQVASAQASLSLLTGSSASPSPGSVAIVA